MDKFKPCPFCGSFKIKAVIDGRGKWHLECENCGIIKIEFDERPMETVKEGADAVEELHKGLMELEMLLRRGAEGG